jgi:acyl-CoA thioesterase FadM
VQRIVRNLAVRGYELGPSGTPSIATFARYFEHLRWESSSDPVMSLARLFTNGSRMVVRAQQIAVDGRVGVGDVLRLSLWVGRVGRTSMDLWHEARLASSEALVARGLVTAVYLGQDHRPCMIPDDIRAMVEPAGATTLVAPLTASAPQGAWHDELRVRPSDIDLFNHVNHAVYAAYFDDARVLALRQGVLPARARQTRAISIDYRREALAGQRLDVAVWMLPESAEDQVGAELRNKDDGEVVCSARLVCGDG